MAKMVFIGGGSAKFVREVTVDLFSFEKLHDARIALMDVDAERAARRKPAHTPRISPHRVHSQHIKSFALPCD